MGEINFTGKVVIVTGSSSGIGKATALEFYRRGACVTLTSFNAEELEDVKQQCLKNGKGQKEPLVILGDIIKDEVVEKIVAETLKTFGKIDILINNAGRAILGDAETQSMKDFDEQFALLIRAPFYLTKLAIPHLLKTKGCIINTSSTASTRPNSDITAYSLFKAAISNYTKSLALHLSPKGVRANAICPGYIDTGIMERAGGSKEQAEFLHKKYTSCHLIDRAGKPEEIADLMVYIASEKAAFMTGSCVVIDGGYTVKQPRLN